MKKRLLKIKEGIYVDPSKITCITQEHGNKRVDVTFGEQNLISIFDKTLEETVMMIEKACEDCE